MLALWAAVWTSGTVSAAAENTLTSEHLTASLVSEQASVRPGNRLNIALHQEMAPQWHTYWRNPGDSGQAPSVAWQLPKGAVASEPQWPAPERIPYGPLVNYGYSDATSLITEIAVPADWPAGTPFPIAAEVELLVCSKICIPVAGSLSLTVPTGGETAIAAEQAALFASARAQQPSPSPWSAGYDTGDDGRLQLTLAGKESDFAALEEAYFFADTWGIVDHAEAQNVVVTGAGLSITLPRGQAALGEKLSGVVALSTRRNGGPVRLTFRVEAAPGAATQVQ